jgi:hypothetical protein
MIRNNDDLSFVRQQMELAEAALRSLRDRVLPKSQANYWLFAEAYVDQIMKLRREIEEYIGIDEHLRQRVASEHNDQASGVIRHIDAGERTFRLCDRGGDLPDLACEFDRFREQDVRANVDRRVVLTGTLRTSGKTGRQTMEVDIVEAAQPAAEPAARPGAA